MAKTKIQVKDKSEAQPESLPVIPPEVHFLADKYVVKLPLSDPYLLESPWELRVHVGKVLERHLGDAVEMTGLKLKKPRLVSKSIARLRGVEPCARAYVTVKF